MWPFPPAPPPEPPYIRRTVIVNLIAPPDVAIRGVCWQFTDPYLVLRNAHGLRANSEPAPIDGEAVIERTNIAFTQVLP